MSAQTLPVQAVLFDYGLVLTGPPDPEAWQRMKDVLRAEEAAFFQAYWQPRHDYDRGALTGEAYWHRVAELLGGSLDDAQRHALLEADVALWTAPNQVMIDWAAALQAAGVRTGILSNLGDAMETGVLAHCGWLGAFDHHTFSHRLGIAKPELAIYEHAAKGLDVAPAHVLFVDDRADNIAAACAAGMLAVQYSDHASFVAEMRRMGFAALLDPATKGVETTASPIH